MKPNFSYMIPNINQPLNPKKDQLLKAVVKEHIHTGFPVASLTLSTQHALDASAATLRNWMSELEQLGYLKQPHPSAGRIPTDQGFRHYVDLLMEKENLTSKEKRFIQRELEAGFREIEDLLRHAADLVSYIGHCTAIALSPANQSLILKSMQLVRVEKHKVLLVLLTQCGLVLDRVVDMDASKDQLEFLSDILNQKLTGIPLSDIGPHLLEQTADEMMANLLSNIVQLITQMIQIENKNRILIEGTHHLLDQPEFKNIEKLKTTLETLQKEERLSRFFERFEQQSALQIFIGCENPLKEFQELSVIAVPYGIQNNRLGTLAIIGPTRMNYDRLIPLIQYTNSILSQFLPRFLA